MILFLTAICIKREKNKVKRLLTYTRKAIANKKEIITDMKTLLIGDMKRIDKLYCWLEKAEEIFDIELIISENELESPYYDCRIEPMNVLNHIIGGEYELVFICSKFYQEIEKILLACGVDSNGIMSEKGICRYLSKTDIMRYYAEYHDFPKSVWDSDCVQMGEFSYCNAEIRSFGDGTKLIVGRFCSIAWGSTIVLGGDHRTDWCSTYPFNEIIEEFSYIEGHPKSKGDIVIGNDVWIASQCKILSGVHIGNGSVIAANTVVAKDVEPYTIVGGNPANVIRKRFDDRTIRKLEEIQWWNWEYEHIYDAIPILQSNQLDQLFKYYDSVVKNKKMHA